MKRLFIITFVIIFYSSHSYSDWFKSGVDDEKISYIEKDTIKHKKSITYFNLMFDYFEPKGGDVLSTINSLAVDCKINMFKTLQISTYNRSMAKGQIAETFNGDHIGWKPIGDGVLNVICDLRKGKYQ